MRALDPHHTPQELRPAQVNAKRLFLTGTIAWVVALGVIGALRLAGHVLDPRLVPMCLVGLGLGLLGWLWSHLVQRTGPRR